MTFILICTIITGGVSVTAQAINSTTVLVIWHTISPTSITLSYHKVEEEATSARVKHLGGTGGQTTVDGLEEGSLYAIVITAVDNNSSASSAVNLVVSTGELLSINV